jgi:hypothetical protein
MTSSRLIDWTGKRYIDSLAHQCGAIDIACELPCCRGAKNARPYFLAFNRYLTEGTAQRVLVEFVVGALCVDAVKALTHAAVTDLRLPTGFPRF